MSKPSDEYREIDLGLLWTLHGLGFTLYVKLTDFNARHESGFVSTYAGLQEDGNE